MEVLSVPCSEVTVIYMLNGIEILKTLNDRLFFLVTFRYPVNAFKLPFIHPFVSQVSLVMVISLHAKVS